jgi:hypothetical protein
VKSLVGCFALLAALAPWAARGSVSTQPGPRLNVPTFTLSKQGRLLWNFEALLVRTFGHRPVSVSDRENFSCSGVCAPLSTYTPYRRVFANPTGSTFHLSGRKLPAGSFGNYPEPVLIRGRTIACDTRGKRFLVAYRDSVSLTLGCLTPRTG